MTNEPGNASSDERVRAARRGMDDAVRGGSGPAELREAGAELLAAEEQSRWDESVTRALNEPSACANCGIESMPGPEGGCPNCGQPMTPA